ALSRLDSELRNSNLWILDVSRKVNSRFTFDRSDDRFPIWSPDESRLVFLSNPGGRTEIYQKVISGADHVETLVQGQQFESIDSWSSDGRFISYTARDEKGKSSLWLAPLSGDRKQFRIKSDFNQSDFNLRHARFSPDGRWLAYVSDESGRDE